MELDMSQNILEKESNEETVEYIYPFEKGFTIYTKSGCKFCTEVKKLLKLNKMDYETIDCDDYLLNNKEDFLTFIGNNAGKSVRTFPMVFYNRKFIGGYIETEKFIISNNAFTLVEWFFDTF